MSDQRLINVRDFMFFITGLTLLAYGVLALLLRNPEPFWWGLPVVLGILTWLIIAYASARAGRQKSDQAFDDYWVYARDKAQGWSYWIALFMYPVFAILMGLGVADYAVTFSAMATLTGASFLLLFVWFDRTR